MLISVKKNGEWLEYDYAGDRPCTEDEFSVIASYVRQYQDEQQSLATKRTEMLALEQKILNAPTDYFSEGNLDALASLAEVEASALLHKADEIQEKIDAIWRLVPEAVTGGGYSLHVARWQE